MLRICLNFVKFPQIKLNDNVVDYIVFILHLLRLSISSRLIQNISFTFGVVERRAQVNNISGILLRKKQFLLHHNENMFNEASKLS